MLFCQQTLNTHSYYHLVTAEPPFIRVESAEIEKNVNKMKIIKLNKREARILYANLNTYLSYIRKLTATNVILYLFGHITKTLSLPTVLPPDGAVMSAAYLVCCVTS